MPHSESMQRIVQRLREGVARFYRRAFRPQLDMRTHEISQVLRSVALLSEFKRSAIRSLAESMHVREYKRDEYIYRERDPGLGIYFVKSGRVRLLTEDDEGNLHESHQASDFEFFGHLAMLGDFRRFETAQAVTETSVLGFFRPELKGMIKRDPGTAAALLHALAGFTAEQYVSLYNVLIEKEGKMMAAHLFNKATKGAALDAPNTSFIVRT